ncbi:MAG: hypothetical protein KIS62_00765 [Ramlibacter sp.]|nr:hypothetical protein [Ramlibacter sp.]
MEEAGEEKEDGALAAPLMLVLSLLLGMRPSTSLTKGFSIGERALFESLKIYQWAVEREIVTRITGVGDGTRDEAHLLDALQKVQHH